MDTSEEDQKQQDSRTYFIFQLFLYIGLLILVFIQALTVGWFDVLVVPEIENDEASLCLFFEGQLRFENVRDCGIGFSALRRNENDRTNGRRAFDFYDCNDWQFIEGLEAVADEMCDILAGGRGDVLQVRRLMIASLFFLVLSLETSLIAAILGLASKLKLQNSDFGEDFDLVGFITLDDNSNATLQLESNTEEYFQRQG